MILLKHLLFESHKVRKHGANSYRVTLSSSRFGQIKKAGSKWHAEVRDTDSGDIVRHAGIWPSLKDAVEELTTLNPADL